ncbi:MAG: acetoacetate decarboxylase family protein, partial [Deltaproteobacteria bacterium]|nr:acetoacetate decarboxylase family protein [Deltaproteobacteria bacterium]
PEGLIINTPALATLLFLRYPFSTLGPYEEAILGIPCTWQGEPRFYIPHIVVNSDIPQVAGLEIWVFPKKMAHISLDKEMDLVFGSMERPKGHRICSAGMRLEGPAEDAEPNTESYSAALRIIPSPEKDAEPSLAELIETHTKTTVLEAWQGTGWISFDSQSMVDPWHKLEVKTVVNTTYRVYDQILGHGKVIKRY